MRRVGLPMTTPSSPSQSTCLEKDGNRTARPVPMIEPAVVFMKNQGSAALVIDGDLPVVLRAISAISSR